MTTSLNPSVWNPASITDVAESLGLNVLPPEVLDHLTRDVEFRCSQVVEEALKYMRHAKRNKLHTADISLALRALDVEPLYGYESTRPLKFGEASIAPGQSLFYLEDEDVEFEKLINAPLPRVPREMSFTAHWLAVEGVQPSIPQNPTAADTTARTDAGLSLLPKPGAGTSGQANALLAATAGQDNVAVKPLVKHILSKELQMYFSTVTAALLDETAEESYRAAALNSLRTDPGLHQLLPYLIQFVAEKVTHSMRNLFVLRQILLLVDALLHNENLHLTPYISALIPPVLTCLIGKRIGPPSISSSNTATTATASTSAPLPNGLSHDDSLTNGLTHHTSTSTTSTNDTPLPPHYPLRYLASSLLHNLTVQKYTASTPTLKPRLARTLLKHLLSPTLQPLGVYYGAVLGLCSVLGSEGVRVLVVPNVREGMNELLREAIDGGSERGEDEDGDESAGVGESEKEREKARVRRREAEEVIAALLQAFQVMAKEDDIGILGGSGMEVDSGTEGLRERLVEKLGDVVGSKVADAGDVGIARCVLDSGLGAGF